MQESGPPSREHNQKHLRGCAASVCCALRSSQLTVPNPLPVYPALRSLSHAPRNLKMSATSTPPAKKKKRLQKYRQEWEEANPWVCRVTGDEYKANCTVCRRVFSVAHGGLSDIKQHIIFFCIKIRKMIVIQFL